jgi:hypothetical protein
MSFLRFRLKQQKRILRCPGLRPSTTLGMERSRSARLNRISSCGGGGAGGGTREEGGRQVLIVACAAYGRS